MAKKLTGHPVPGYALKLYPVPNSITTFGLALLTLAFGWMAAAKIWLVLYLAVALATTFYVMDVFQSQARLWWVLPAVLFFGQTFWFAAVSFSLGICLLLVLACLLFRQQERTGTIACLILLCFFTHLIVYAAAGIMVLLYCIQHQRWRLTWVGLTTLPLPAWYFVGRSLSHVNETAFGYSPTSHLLPAVLAAMAVLTVAFLRPRLSLSRSLAPLLVGAVVILCAAALLVSILSALHVRSGPLSAVSMVQLKALTPFEMFGFVNLLYEPNTRPVVSATMTLLHQPLFAGLMALDLGVGFAFLVGFAKTMSGRRDEVGIAAPGAGRPERFLWDFVALFALLYLVCPPNALGVISIDMRLAQMAMVPALFLFARAPSRIPRYAGLPAVLLLLASLYQFTVSQQRVRIAGTVTGMPSQLASFAGVDPTSIAEEYDRLRAGKLEGFIFATGIFYQTPSEPPHADGLPVSIPER